MRRWAVGLMVVTSTVLATVQRMSAQGEAPCSFGVSYMISVGGTQKVGVPFLASVKTTFEQRLADGNAIHGFQRSQMARSAMGKTRNETGQRCFKDEGGKPTLAYSVNVYDPTLKVSMYWHVNGEMVGGPDKIVLIHHRIDPVAKTLTAEESAAQQARQKISRMQMPERSEYKSEDLGEKTLHGVTVHGYRTVQTIPIGREGNDLPIEVMSEDWRSQALGIDMLMIRDDPRRGRTTVEVEEISLSEPDASLFAAPAGYTVKDDSVPAVSAPSN